MSNGIQRTYRARAIDGAFGYSKNNTEEVVVRFQIAEGPDAGGVFHWYGYFNTHDNSKRSIEALRRCGWQGDDVTNLQGLGTVEVEIVVVDEIYEGKKRTRVSWVNDIGGGPLLSRPMDEGQKRAFAERLRGTAMSIKPTTPQPAAGSGRGHPADWDV